MTSVGQNFEMWAGDDKSLRVPITGSDGAGYDMTGATVVWVLEQAPGSGSLIRKDTSSGIAISGSTVTITLAASDTSLLEGLFFHEAQAADLSGRTATLFVGTAKINKSGAN